MNFRLTEEQQMYRRAVREFVERVFAKLDLDWNAYVEIDPRYLRPTEVDYLRGDASRARERLGWAPETSFDTLIDMMIAHDRELARQEKTLRDAGHEVVPRGVANG